MQRSNVAKKYVATTFLLLQKINLQRFLLNYFAQLSL